MMSTQSTPPPSIERTVKTIVILFAGFAFAAFLLYVWGATSLSGFTLWLTRLGVVGLVVTGLIAWRLPIKLVFLPGEQDEWYVLVGWDGRTIGFVRSGINRILPIQYTEKWKRVTPLFVKHDFPAQNRLLDSFDVHVRVMLDIYPSHAMGGEARLLRDQYPDKITGIVIGILSDAITQELRKVASFTKIIEREVEQHLKDTINSKFGFLEKQGIYINEAATFIDVMVSTELLMQRMKARAELSTLQIIRDVAHDMGISTDELLIQRALEKLPDSRSRQSVTEIAAVLRMLRTQPLPPLPDQTSAYDMGHVVEEENREDEEEIMGDTVGPETSVYRPPSSYVEGQFKSVKQRDPNDPDSEDEGSGAFYSPFQT